MSEVAAAARDAIAEHGDTGIMRFSVCQVPGRHGHPVKAWRWATTDRDSTVRFLLACWNNRHALAKLDQ